MGTLVLAFSTQLEFSTIFTLSSAQGFKQSPLILETILRVSGCELSPLDSKHPLQLFPPKGSREADILGSIHSLIPAHTFHFLTASASITIIFSGPIISELLY